MVGRLLSGATGVRGADKKEAERMGLPISTSQKQELVCILSTNTSIKCESTFILLKMSGGRWRIKRENKS